jgi:type I restriction enzyme R subunit
MWATVWREPAAGLAELAKLLASHSAAANPAKFPAPLILSSDPSDPTAAAPQVSELSELASELASAEFPDSSVATPTSAPNLLPTTAADLVTVDDISNITPIDQIIYSLCQPTRLLALSYQFILFDRQGKKIARYQQYFAVTEILARVKQIGADGRRLGGVVWHTQGSGKSLTMVLLAKALALDPAIANPRVVLVTDRVDLDEQLYTTFRHCGKEVVQARSGRDLWQLLRQNRATVITTVIDKFEAAVKVHQYQDDSSEIFVLIDESHRSQYGKAHNQMRRVLPRACYLGFTGTPLMQKERNTARLFGGIISKYTIEQAVADRAVVPLLYEARLIWEQISPSQRSQLDTKFKELTASLHPAQSAQLQRRASTSYPTDEKLYLIACDIREHFRRNWQNTGFKGQIVADSKIAALQLQQCLQQFGDITAEVLISAPETKEGQDETQQQALQQFWQQQMQFYSSEKEYNRQIIRAFKEDATPEIIIVVDKLLTGFDAPRNSVLYLARNLKNHALLQAIARVNRTYPGKDFGYIVDYYGVLGELNTAWQKYAGLSEFNTEEVAGCVIEISREIAKLADQCAAVWSILGQSQPIDWPLADSPAAQVPLIVDSAIDPEKFAIDHEKIVAALANWDYEPYLEILADDGCRDRFYRTLFTYSRTLGIALSTIKSPQDAKDLRRYKQDLCFFQQLRAAARQRYATEVDHPEYETKLQKLIARYVSARHVLQLTPPLNIFDREFFQQVLAQQPTAAAKADLVSYHLKKACYREGRPASVPENFSALLEKTIRDYREKRISEIEYWRQASTYWETALARQTQVIPDLLQGQKGAPELYLYLCNAFQKVGLTAEPALPLATEHPDANLPPSAAELATTAAWQIAEIIKHNVIVDWHTNLDVHRRLLNEIEDYWESLQTLTPLTLSLAQLDELLAQLITVAKTVYPE